MFEPDGSQQPGQAESRNENEHIFQSAVEKYSKLFVAFGIYYPAVLAAVKEKFLNPGVPVRIVFKNQNQGKEQGANAEAEEKIFGHDCLLSMLFSVCKIQFIIFICNSNFYLFVSYFDCYFICLCVKFYSGADIFFCTQRHRVARGFQQLFISLGVADIASLCWRLRAAISISPAMVGELLAYAIGAFGL